MWKRPKSIAVFVVLLVLAVYVFILLRGLTESPEFRRWERSAMM